MKHTFIHIIIACLSLALTAKAQTDGCVVTAFPYSEGFENDGGKLPECWEQEFVTNQMEWIVTNGGHSGEYKVFMPLGSGQVTKLISPRLDISTLKSPTLTFWQLSPAWEQALTCSAFTARHQPPANGNRLENTTKAAPSGRNA